MLRGFSVLISTTMEMQLALVSICGGPTLVALEENEVEEDRKKLGDKTC